MHINPINIFTSVAFRIFLQNCPEAVKSLLDNCIVASEVNSDNIGKVVFDFFLFHPDNSDNELAIVDLVIATDKKKLIEHPLFETFIRLKWIKVWKVYTVSFSVLCLFMVSMISFTLLNYSTIFVHTDATIKQVFWVLLLVTTVLLSLLHTAKLHHLLCRSCVTRSAKHKSLLSDWKARQERVYPVLDTLTPVLGFLILFVHDPTMVVALILYSSWQFMRSLTMFPRVGKHVFITSRVTRTISEFFLSYLIEILAFTVSFHVLLNRDTAMFRSLDDSFVFVITMLLGELDYASLAEAGDNKLVVKVRPRKLSTYYLVSLILPMPLFCLSYGKYFSVKKYLTLHSIQAS